LRFVCSPEKSRSVAPRKNNFSGLGSATARKKKQLVNINALTALIHALYARIIKKEQNFRSLVWAYPLEFTDASAGQGFRSDKSCFTSIVGISFNFSAERLRG